MTTERTSRRYAWLWKIPLIGGAYFVATMISGAMVTALGLQFPEFPGHTSNPALSFVASIVLGVTLYLLARGVGGSSGLRWLVLFAFIYVSYCVNNQIEGATFTTAGAYGTMLVFFVLPCAVIAGLAALLVKPTADGARMTTVFSDGPVSSWWWRVVLAWLAFPFIYYFFGMLAYPFVADSYQGGELGLRVPSQGLIFAVVTLRSLFFLLVTIPILATWSASRRSLFIALAAAFSAMVGVAGLIESAWLPTSMRVIHSVEIIADSIVHAWVLVALLVPGRHRASAEMAQMAANEVSTD
jgi:hypothetical protein